MARRMRSAVAALIGLFGAGMATAARPPVYPDPTAKTSPSELDAIADVLTPSSTPVTREKIDAAHRRLRQLGPLANPILPRLEKAIGPSTTRLALEPIQACADIDTPESAAVLLRFIVDPLAGGYAGSWLRTMGPAAVEPSLTACQSDDEHTRDRAAYALAGLGPEILPRLRAALADPAFKKHIKAIKSVIADVEGYRPENLRKRLTTNTDDANRVWIYQTEPAPYRPAAVVLLGDADPRVRGLAVQIIQKQSVGGGGYDDVRYRRYLETHYDDLIGLCNSADPAVQKLAAGIRHDVYHEDPQLPEKLLSADENVVSRAMADVPMMGGVDCLAPLMKLASSAKNIEVRRAAMRLTMQIPDPAAGDRIVKTLVNPDVEWRLAAVAVCSAREAKDAPEMLRAAAGATGRPRDWVEIALAEPTAGFMPMVFRTLVGGEPDAKVRVVCLETVIRAHDQSQGRAEEFEAESVPAVGAVREMAATDPSPAVRTLAGRAAALMAGPAALVEALRSTDPAVRTEAAAALETDNPTPELRAALSAAATDHDPAVRAAVAYSVARFGKALAPVLAKLTGDPAPGVRLMAVEASYRNPSPENRNQRKQFADAATTDADEHVRTTASLIVAAMDRQAAQFKKQPATKPASLEPPMPLEKLRAVLTDPVYGRTSRQLAMVQISQYGPASSAAAADISALLKSDRETQSVAFSVLRTMGPAAAAAVPDIAAMLDTSDEPVGRLAAVTLRGLGSVAAPAIPQLAAAMHRPGNIAGSAGDALRATGPGAAVAFAGMLRDGPTPADGALRQLHDMGRGAAPALGALVDYLHNPPATATDVWYAVETVGTIGPAAAPAGPTVAAYLTHADPRERSAAAATLARLGTDALTPDVVKQLQAAAGDKDFTVVAAVADAMGVAAGRTDVDAAGVVESLRVAVDRLVTANVASNYRDDVRWKSIARVATALGDFGPRAKPAIASLTAACKSPDEDRARIHKIELAAVADAIRRVNQ